MVGAAVNVESVLAGALDNRSVVHLPDQPPEEEGAKFGLLGNRSTLRYQHIDLPKIRDDLLRLVRSAGLSIDRIDP